MKLRNKKTGEIAEFEPFYCFRRKHDKYPDTVYESLAKFNSDWEDYTPKEILIKDEKIRKIVRAWAKINNSKELRSWNNYQLQDEGNYLIEFEPNCFDNLEVGRKYTITELCGKEQQ